MDAFRLIPHIIVAGHDGRRCPLIPFRNMNIKGFWTYFMVATLTTGEVSLAFPASGPIASWVVRR